MESFDRTTCLPQSALQVPGKKPGQVIVVEVPDKGPCVFQWNEPSRKWEFLGEAIGQREARSSGPSSVSDGSGAVASASSGSSEYDHV
jgi:hypothetical protein